MKTELIALKGKLYTKSFQLGEGQKLVIGRSEEVDIQILDHGLSRQHCCFEKQGDTFFLADLQSRNGTWVNGNRIERAELKPGDMIRIGGIEFEFRVGPDRRQVNADLIAAVPDRATSPIAERVDVDSSDLMDLSAKFQSMENFRRVQRDLATIYKIGNLISAESDLKRLYVLILDAILQVVRADRSFLILANAAGTLETIAQRERGPGANAPDTGFSTTVAEECFRDKTSILRANALTDDRYGRAESILTQHIHSVLAVPVEAPDHVIGVLYADTVGESEVFQKHDLELLVAIGKQAGVAIQRVQIGEQLTRMLRGAVKALAAAIEAKDDYTRGHSERVTAYAVKIGAAMGLPDEQIRRLELGGFLHDVGKIGVPENILRKAGPLTEAEYEIVKQHSRLGANIVRNIEGADDIAETVLHHHERWDGKGYPDGLSQNKCSLLARILCVADAFDAMSSQRPYRDRLAREKVLRTVREASGRQFDPKVVDAFMRTIAETEEPGESRRSMAATTSSSLTSKTPSPK